MTISPSQYEYYTDLHNDFSEAYQLVNKYVLDLYILPKRFIEETGPVLDQFLRNYSVPGAPVNRSLSSRAVLDFISQVDDFTIQTVKLFEEHKVHVNECADYMKKVFALKQKYNDEHSSDFTADYIRLTPQLLDLHGGLKTIKLKADDMVERLEKLEQRWKRMRTVINP